MPPVERWRAFRRKARAAIRSRHLRRVRWCASHSHATSHDSVGRSALAHKHATHETAIYALSGVSHVWHGERLEHHSVVEPGNFFYIPADVPHLPYNPSKTEAGYGDYRSHRSQRAGERGAAAGARMHSSGLISHRLNTSTRLCAGSHRRSTRMGSAQQTKRTDLPQLRPCPGVPISTSQSTRA